MTGQSDSGGFMTGLVLDERNSIELTKINSKLGDLPEKNQLELAGERIKKLKVAGSYYYIGRLSLSGLTFFSNIFFDIFAWYLLPVVALGAIFRSYLNIREWQEAQAANGNLLRKVFLNTGMALGAIAAVVLFFTLGVAYLNLLPSAMALFYTGTFLFKTCQSAYYLYNFFKAEPGSDYRNECWDRFKRYGTSALASLFAAGIAVVITLTHVVTGGWASLGLFGAALVVNTFNTVTVAHGDLSKGPSKIEAALKHFKFINDKATKKTILMQLINDKIKNLDKEIKTLNDLKAETDALGWGFKKFSNKCKQAYYYCVSASPEVLVSKKIFLQMIHADLKNNSIPNMHDLLKAQTFSVFNGETALLAHAVEDLSIVTTAKPKLDYDESIIDTMKLIKDVKQREAFLREQINNKIDALGNNQSHKKDFLCGLNNYLNDISKNSKDSLSPNDFLDGGALYLASELDENELKPNRIYLKIEDNTIKYRTLASGDHFVLLEKKNFLQYTELHQAITESDLSKISQLGKNSLLDVISKNSNIVRTCNLENNPFTTYRHDVGQTETLFYAVATHREMLEKDAGRVSSNAFTTKNLKDIETLVKSIDDPKARKRYMLELLSTKIKELSKSIDVSPKIRHKYEALIWLRSWIEFNQKPKPFTVYVKRDRMVDWLLSSKKIDPHTANTKMISNMNQWLAHLEKDVDFKDDVYSAYVPSFGETHILIRAVVAYVAKYDKEQKDQTLSYDKKQNEQTSYDNSHFGQLASMFSAIHDDGKKDGPKTFSTGHVQYDGNAFSSSPVSSAASSTAFS